MSGMGQTMDAPTRFDLPTTSRVNKEVIVYNRKLYKRMKQFEHVNIINSELHRKYFTKHGMHMNTAGKEQTAQRLAEHISETFSKKETSPITLQWKQDVAKRIVSPQKHDTETNMGETVDNPQENQSLQSGIDNKNANNSENPKETIFLSSVTDCSKNSLKDVNTSFSISNLNHLEDRNLLPGGMIFYGLKNKQVARYVTKVKIILLIILSEY
jgi:hypothetical protein